MKNYKLATILQNKTWTNPKIKNHKKSNKLQLIGPQTQHKYLEHMYLKFLKPLTPFVEKTGSLHGFQ